MQRIPLLLMGLALALVVAGAVVRMTSAGDVNLGPVWILAMSLALGAVLLFDRPDERRWDDRWDERRRYDRR